MTNQLQPTLTFQTKTAAVDYQVNASNKYGGAWELKKTSRGWCVEHTMTGRQKRYLAAKAQMTLFNEAEYDFFTGRFGLTFAKKQLAIQIEQWKAKLDNPFEAFRWADDAIRAAAEYAVVYRLLAYADKLDDTRDEVVLKEMEEETTIRCRNQSYKSSSMIGNIVDEAERIAYVKYTEDLRRWVVGKREATAALKAIEAEIANTDS